MNVNSHQQQLLQILNIKTLDLNADFQRFSSDLPQKHHLTDKEPQQLSRDDSTEFALLFSDIQLLLSQLTPTLTWQSQPQATCCYLDADVLITPELSLLQQSTFKRQLWQLLNTRLNDV